MMENLSLSFRQCRCPAKAPGDESRAKLFKRRFEQKLLACVRRCGESVHMNTASQDLRHHLGVLREKMLADYEQAVSYFLEEFAGDAKFIEQSEPDDAPHLLPVLAQVTSKAIGGRVSFDVSRVF